MRGKIEAVLDSLIGSRTPGLQYLVLNAAGPLFQYNAGLADIRRHRPMNEATTLNAYSMSKTSGRLASRLDEKIGFQHLPVGFRTGSQETNRAPMRGSSIASPGFATVESPCLKRLYYVGDAVGSYELGRRCGRRFFQQSIRRSGTCRVVAKPSK